MPFCRVFVLLFCLVVARVSPTQACIDSIAAQITPVSCNGLRNGFISIDSVYGGEGPFYFSLDGVTWSTRPTFERLWSGTYTIFVRNDSGCFYTETALVTEPELLTLVLQANTNLIPVGGTVHLTAFVNPPGAVLSEINWRPPNLPNISSTLELTTQLSESTNVSVEVKTAEGCTARDQIYIEVEKPLIYIPNVIQPGSVQNAYFTVYGDWSVFNIPLLQVYDRGGNLLFERVHFWPNDPLMGWNGKFRNKTVSPGVYSWRAVIQFLDGHVEHRTGTVTVVL